MASDVKVGFLFDNDGVLIDSSAFHWQSWQQLMKEETDFVISYETFHACFGKRNEAILKQADPEGDKSRHERLALRKEELFRELVRGKIGLLDGMDVFLQSLKENHIPRIIASSTPKENLKLYLSSTPLGFYFNDFVSGEDVAHGKPAPDIFFAAAKKIGLPSHHCIVIEDAPAGIESGKAAGSFVIALATTHKKESLKGYDLILNNPSDLRLEEILQAFEKWQQTHKHPKWKNVVGIICISLGLIFLLTPLPGLFLMLLGFAFINNPRLQAKIQKFIPFYKSKR